MSSIPTLDNLLDRLRTDVTYRESFREICRRVASGERHPTSPPLPENLVKFLCQAMVILINHADGEEIERDV